MNMIGQQNISVESVVIFGQRTFKATEISRVVAFAKENRITIIAPLYNVIRESRQIKPRLSRHSYVLFVS